jgi:hypothetical protein
MVLAMLGLGLSGSAQAGEPVRLQDGKREGATVVGSCGAATVHVWGVQDGWIVNASGKIEIKSGARTLVIGEDGRPLLEDRSALACVDAKAGPRLVLLTYCDGRSCPSSNYFVIDPGMATILTNAEYGECPLSCAETALGMRLPKELQDGVSGFK